MLSGEERGGGVEGEMGRGNWVWGRVGMGIRLGISEGMGKGEGRRTGGVS